MPLEILVCGLLNDEVIRIINKIGKTAIFYLLEQPTTLSCKFYTRLPENRIFLRSDSDMSQFFDGLIVNGQDNWKSLANKFVKKFVYSDSLYIRKCIDDKYEEIMSDNLKTLAGQDEIVTVSIIIREMDDYFFDLQWEKQN